MQSFFAGEEMDTEDKKTEEESEKKGEKNEENQDTEDEGKATFLHDLTFSIIINSLSNCLFVYFL